MLIQTAINGQALQFQTSEHVFSPGSVDPGTLAMLSKVEFEEHDRVLDLGCGYGVVGILAAKFAGSGNVVMVDNNEEAVNLAKMNARLNGVEHIVVHHSDGFRDFRETDFTKILSNPPYHVDFDVPKAFIEKGFNRLVIGGRMFMVTKRKDWYKNKLISIFGGVKIWEENGYFVFMSTKLSPHYANKKQKNR